MILSFDLWLDYTFNRTADGKSQCIDPTLDDRYLWQEEFESQGDLLLAHCIRLFEDPVVYTARYSEAQREQGWTFLAYDDGYLRFLWHVAPEVAVQTPIKIACLRSMYPLFAKLFQFDQVATTCFMWWGECVLMYFCNDGVGTPEEKEAFLQPHILGVMGDILKLDSRPCWESVLHGLGTLQDRGAAQAMIEQFLVGHPTIDPEPRKYAEACIIQDMM